VSPEGGAQAPDKKVTRQNLGAWMVKCNPKVWDLEGFLQDGNDLIDDWSVQENYRSALMQPGDLIFFWVTGNDRARLTPGVWGVGHVVAPTTWEVYPADDEADGYWLDHEARLRARHFAQVRIPLVERPLPRREVIADARLGSLEVIVSPQMGNPQFVSVEEREALLDLLGVDPPAVPEPLAEQIVVDKGGAGFGDPLTNQVVESLAMDAVTEHLEAEGWRCEDVSAAKCGWDITARRDGEERHVEVKGVSGAKSTVLLTRNEFLTAQADSKWCLMVVAQALSKQELHEYDAATAVAAAEPYVYRAEL
jgi:predicted RNA-binding protein with PUA-like domain